MALEAELEQTFPRAHGLLQSALHAIVVGKVGQNDGRPDAAGRGDLAGQRL